MNVKILQKIKKKTLLKKCGWQNWLYVYLCFNPLVETVEYIDCNQFSCRGLEVTHTAMREVPGLISGSGKDFYVCFFVSLL